ncbi:MAG TPA: hypothetical protein VMP11_12845 [Verrucomicrobiae bacterium]|nr:hypothetical protein [Verrucomicrobiae bacterium]
MKTTVEIPSSLFRKWKTSAAARGQSMKEFLTSALQEKLAGRNRGNGRDTGWKTVWGKASAGQIRNVDAVIQAEFEKIEPENWR